MSGLTDSVTIGIVLTLIFGAVAFYLYSRMAQNEKRVGLLENLLMTLKLSTEASLYGPDMVEPISHPVAVEVHDVDEVSEGEYADLLKGIAPEEKRAPTPIQEEEEVLRPMEPMGHMSSVEPMEPMTSMENMTSVEVDVAPQTTRRAMDANYESMSLKELNSLAKERGLTGVANRKRDLIDALKKQGGDLPIVPGPLIPAVDELEGVTSGFTVTLNE